MGHRQVGMYMQNRKRLMLFSEKSSWIFTVRTTGCVYPDSSSSFMTLCLSAKPRSWPKDGPLISVENRHSKMCLHWEVVIIRGLVGQSH